MTTLPSKALETFPNPAPQRDFCIRMRIPEFTCLCPKTGQPDFGTLYLEYVADKACVELKSLKLYVWSFRDEGCFHEAVTNQILDDLVRATGLAAGVVLTVLLDLELAGRLERQAGNKVVLLG